MFFKKEKKKEQTPKEVLASLSFLQSKIENLEEKITQLEKENKEMIQKIGIIRFNPFSGTGGDQSFSLALLNKKNNGAIITSFYTSEGSSVYGKPIKEGKSKYVLSDNEKKAIEMAINDECSEHKKE